MSIAQVKKKISKILYSKTNLIAKFWCTDINVEILNTDIPKFKSNEKKLFF